MKKARACELCGGDAALYCPSDSAFLCSNCDDNVHRANFLVARHHRFVFCSNCTELTGNRISGVGNSPLSPICVSCSHGSPLGKDYSFSSSTSDCISSAESCATPPNQIESDRRKPHVPAKKFRETKKREVDPSRRILRRVGEAKAEGLLVNWCRKLRVAGEACETAMPLAMEAFGVCVTELTVLPLRVSLVASLWLSLRLCADQSGSTWQVLKLLEELSGVPAKLILASESRLARIFRKRGKPQLQEEGWAEC